jgi:hypothetical protein
MKITTLMAAKLLGISQPGAYFVFGSDSQLILAAVDSSRAMHAPKSSKAKGAAQQPARKPDLHWSILADRFSTRRGHIHGDAQSHVALMRWTHLVRANPDCIHHRCSALRHIEEKRALWTRLFIG